MFVDSSMCPTWQGPDCLQGGVAGVGGGGGHQGEGGGGWPGPGPEGEGSAGSRRRPPRHRAPHRDAATSGPGTAGTWGTDT